MTSGGHKLDAVRVGFNNTLETEEVHAEPQWFLVYITSGCGLIGYLLLIFMVSSSAAQVLELN